MFTFGRKSLLPSRGLFVESEAVKEDEIKESGGGSGSAIVRKKAAVAPAAENDNGGKKKGKAKAKVKVKAAKSKKAREPREARLITDPSTLKAPAGNDKMKERVAAAQSLKVGEVREFTGRDEKLRGKKVRVVGFRKNAGLYIEHDGKRYPVAPWSVGILRPGAAAKAEKKAKRDADKKAKAEKKAADKKAKKDKAKKKDNGD